MLTSVPAQLLSSPNRPALSSLLAQLTGLMLCICCCLPSHSCFAVWLVGHANTLLGHGPKQRMRRCDCSHKMFRAAIQLHLERKEKKSLHWWARVMRGPGSTTGVLAPQLGFGVGRGCGGVGSCTYASQLCFAAVKPYPVLCQMSCMC